VAGLLQLSHLSIRPRTGMAKTARPRANLQPNRISPDKQRQSGVQIHCRLNRAGKPQNFDRFPRPRRISRTSAAMIGCADVQGDVFRRWVQRFERRQSFRCVLCIGVTIASSSRSSS
jgi:hypothetical protein